MARDKKSQPVQVKDPEGPVTYVVQEEGRVVLETPDIYKALHRSKALSLCVKVYRKPDNVLIAYRNRVSLTEEEAAREYYGNHPSDEEEPGSILDSVDECEVECKEERKEDTRSELAPVVVGVEPVEPLVALQPRVVVEIAAVAMCVVVVELPKADTEVQEKKPCQEVTLVTRH